MGKTKFDTYLEYLQNKHGISEMDARALLGNFKKESELESTATNSSGYYGLAQWSPDTAKGKGRQSDLRAFAAQNNRKVDDPYTQLDFAMHELKNGAHKSTWAKMQAAKDLESKTRVVYDSYEAPGKDDKTFQTRLDYANGMNAGQPSKEIKVSAKYLNPLNQYPQQIPQVPYISVTTVKGLDNSAEAQIRRRGYVYDYAATKTPKGSINPIDVQQDKNLASVPSTPKKSLASNILPFASNIANAFTKIPAPPVPGYGSPISLKRVDMSNDRNEVERGTRSMDRFAEQQFDPQTGYQTKAFNNAQRFSQLSKVNQDERIFNTGIANEEMKANLLISSQNQNLKNSYDNTLFERKLAQQRFNQENLTNASDKYSAIQDRDAMERSAKYSADLQMSRDTYGEFKRHQDMWNAEQEAQKKKTVTDVAEGKRYGGKMRNGGIMSNYTAGSMFKMNFKRIN